MGLGPLSADSVKKSAMVSTAEKYAFEIEISTLSRGFRAQIPRSCAQKRHYQQSVHAQHGRTDFFQNNRPIADISSRETFLSKEHRNVDGGRSFGPCD